MIKKALFSLHFNAYIPEPAGEKRGKLQEQYFKFKAYQTTPAGFIDPDFTKWGPKGKKDASLLQTQCRIGTAML